MDPQSSHHSHPEIPEQDPAHDIDGKKTWLWLLGCTVGVFVTVWLLALVFNEVIHNQRVQVIELAPTTQRDELQAREAEALAAGEGRIGIDEAIQKYLQRKRD
jgi:hypothetical protein